VWQSETKMKGRCGPLQSVFFLVLSLFFEPILDFRMLGIPESK
jgi:hypothetical protein